MTSFSVLLTLEKISKLKQQESEKQKALCTFKPKINKISSVTNQGKLRFMCYEGSAVFNS